MISAKSGGFKKTEVSFTLNTGGTQDIDVHLVVATAAAAVNVTAEAAPLNMDESRIQATLSADTVRDLPQLNRNIYDVLAVTPGVVGTGTRGPGESPGGGADNFGTQTPQLSANGRSYTGNRVLVDGMVPFKMAISCSPRNNLVDATFGKVTSALSARQIQLGLRISF